MIIPLSHISPNQSARIEFLGNEDCMARRLNDLGFVSGSTITCILQKSQKNIAAYLVRGAVIALREDDSRLIFVSPLPPPCTDQPPIPAESMPSREASS